MERAKTLLLSTDLSIQEISDATHYSEKGCRDRKWKVPTGVKLANKAKACTVTAKGREEFNKFKVNGNSVTLTLAPNEMVLIR